MPLSINHESTDYFINDIYHVYQRYMKIRNSPKGLISNTNLMKNIYEQLDALNLYSFLDGNAIKSAKNKKPNPLDNFIWLETYSFELNSKLSCHYGTNA